MVSLSPSQLTFLTTSKCTARCEHCSVRSGPERTDMLDFEKMRETVDELIARGGLKLVIFAGGEPTLLGKALLDIVAHCDANGLITRLVTNASWASTPASSARKVEALRNAGLAELNLSADDYHLPYIPFQNVKNAWHAAQGQGFSAVVIANCYGPKSIVTPAFIKRELGLDLEEVYDEVGVKKPLVRRAADGTTYGLSNAYLQNLGRGREMLEDDVFFGFDDDQMISGGCPWAIRSAAVSPKNHLVACCGMEAEHNPILDFGDLNRASSDKLLARANGSVAMNAIARLGPVFLKRFLRQYAPEVALAERHHTMCELCEEIVTSEECRAALRRHAPLLAAYVLGAQAAAEEPRAASSAERTE